MKTIYVENRDSLIKQIMMDVHSVYYNDKELCAGVSDLTVQLMVADPNESFVNDLRGFRMYCILTNQDSRKALSTIIHDLSEFAKNRNEKWFCPRTRGYSKYLSGASNFQVI